MNLQRRLARLEARLGRDVAEPLVIVFRVDRAKGPMRVKGENADIKDIKAEATSLLAGFADAIEAEHTPCGFAMIGAGRQGDATNLKLANGETEAAFMSRVESEAIRIHGRLPADWTRA
jgi:hypothetical protein